MLIYVVDVINVVSVTGPAKVSQWREADDEEIEPGLYWRQTLNIHKSQISVWLTPLWRGRCLDQPILTSLSPLDLFASAKQRSILTR